MAKDYVYDFELIASPSVSNKVCFEAERPNEAAAVGSRCGELRRKRRIRQPHARADADADGH